MKFKKISQLLDFLKQLEEKEPITSEKLARDVELSEKGSLEIQSTVRGKGAVSALLPDLSTIPPSFVGAEAGMAIVEGFGRSKIQFEKSFSDTPTVIAIPFGFFELKVPWVAVEWRSFTIGWWTVRLPVPQVTSMTIRLPTMCFMMNIEKDGFEVFNVSGRTTICYFAFGR